MNYDNLKMIKSTWSLINQLLNLKKKKAPAEPIEILRRDGTLDKFFVNVGFSLASNIKD